MVLTLLGAGPGSVSSAPPAGTERTIIGFSNLAGITSAGTYYVPPGGQLTSAATTHDQVAVKWRGAGTFKNFYVKASTNSWTATPTVTLYVNGVATSLSVSLSGTSGNDTTHSVTVNDGDLVAFGLTMPAGSGTVTLTCCTAQFETTGQISKMLVGVAGTPSSSSSSGFYRPSGGQLVLFGSAGSSGSGASSRALESCTISHLQLYASDTGAASMVVNSYVGAAAGNQSFTVASGAAGLNEDTTHSDALTANTIYAVQRAATGVNRSTTMVAYKYVSDTSKVSMLQCGANGTIDRATAYGNLLGGSPFNVFNSSETYVGAIAPCAGSVSALSFYVNTNASTADITAQIVVNGTPTGNTVTITAGATGFFGPMVGSVSLNQGDTVSIVYTGRTTGNAVLGWVGALFTDTN